jgi:trigger factor
MQVTQMSYEGLKRELKVTIPKGELTQRFSTRIDEVRDQVQIKGFRKGKVPTAHIKKLYGRSLMAEVLQQAVEESTLSAIKERNERAAHQPSINVPEDRDEMERVLSGQSDFAFTMSYETLPEIALTDLASLKLEREVADVTPEAIDKALADLAERSIRYEAEADRAAGDGDRLTIDFVGRVDGVEFEGGKGEDVQLVVGQTQFIPGFVEGIVGAKAGDERDVNAKFPETYPEASLAGKDAVFSVKAKEVAKPIRPEINDEFAKSLGAESVETLRSMVAARIGAEYGSVANNKLKRQILDALDKGHDFALPETLVTSEFEGIWRQLTQSLEQAGKTIADEGKSEDEVRAAYRKIAERRVRLGLLIGEIGQKAKVEVGEEEMRRALIEEARRYPGQQKEVFGFYQKNPGALASLRAPIFEDKVIEHILAQSKPTEKKVSVEELLKPVEGDDPLEHLGHDHAHHHHDHDHHHHGHDHDHDHGHHHHDHDHDHHHHDHGHDHHDHDHGHEKK